MYIPLGFDEIAAYAGRRSVPGLQQNSLQNWYFARAFYDRAASLFKWSGLPEFWPLNYFNYVLIACGFVPVVHAEIKEVPLWVPLFGTPGKLDMFYQPKEIIVSNSEVHKTFTVGDNCELLRMTDDFIGLFDIIDHYTNELAIAWTSHQSSLINARFVLAAIAKNKAAGETLKAIGEKLSAGDPLIIVDQLLQNSKTGELPIEIINSDPAQASRVALDMLDVIRDIIAQFDAEIGIPSVDLKKERMITGEVDAMTADANARVSHWLDNLRRSCDNVNRLAGLNISVSIRGGDEDVIQTDADRDL